MKKSNVISANFEYYLNRKGRYYFRNDSGKISFLLNVLELQKDVSDLKKGNNYLLEIEYERNCCDNVF